MSTLWPFWAPPDERSTIIGLANAGSQIGNVTIAYILFHVNNVSSYRQILLKSRWLHFRWVDFYASMDLTAAGLLFSTLLVRFRTFRTLSCRCNDNSSIMIVVSLNLIQGVIGLCWCVLWFALVTDSPTNHRFISHHERDYIVDATYKMVSKSGKQV